jgi:glucosamine--fructose-6-phosphate aminotransferase (isomerizing)
MNKFLAEILEQPDAMEKALRHYLSSEGQKSLNRIRQTIDKYKIGQIIFTGMGSSYFASHAASCLFNELKMHSFAMNASELLHYNFSLFERETLLVCISQSGESYEVQEMIKKLPSSVHCVGIVNEENSTLAHHADVALFCKAGREEMTSTKTYVSTSLVSFISGWSLSGNWKDEASNRINRLISSSKLLLTNYDPWVNDMLTFLGDIQTIQIIARGPSFSTACQSALMFKEATRIPATGILGGEFRHGPMEMVAEGFKAILFAAKGNTLMQSMKMAEDICKYGGRVLLITNEKLQFQTEKLMQIHIDEPDEYLFSIQSIIPVQLFIDSYAKSKGFEAGSFSRGAKVTVVE